MTSHFSGSRMTTRRLQIFFAFLGGVLVFSVALMFFMGRAVSISQQRIARKQVVTNAVREALSTLKDAETGHRGYLLTMDPAYLEPYLAAKARMPMELGQLQKEDLPEETLRKFNELAAAKFAQMEKTIDLAKQGKPEEALALLRTNEGKLIMDQLRVLAGNLIVEEDAQLEKLRQDAAFTQRAQVALFIVVVLVNLGFLAWSFRRIRHDIEEQNRGNALLAEREELLRVTLGSIGDGVIVTDIEGKITSINPVAEKLTGWESARALGENCSKIFRILNETTRDAVLSPVDKVLEDGSIVGLANHTLLIRADGSELPIDDSGAPIRDQSGKVRGVVLVFRDFSEYKATEAKLREAMEAAEGANIAKDNFLATLSHELRTPLSPVQTALALWGNDLTLPEQLRADFEMMRRNVDLEARLIDDLLDLTRIVRGKLFLNPETANAEDLIGAVARMYQSEIQARGQTFSFSLEAQMPYILVDSARLQQVLLNVLKNATKFTPTGGNIRLTLFNDDAGKVTIEVSDDGIGMEPELLGKLFLPFEQGAEEVVRRYGGLGLGMAISKALIEAQGGEITATSAGMGQGSTFVIRLPPAEPPSALPTLAQPTPQAAGRSLQILLVEDHEDTARMLSRLLKRWGHEVEYAGTLKQALSVLEEKRFDLLLSDVGLPDGTGMDLIRQIRRKMSLPAVALTGYGMEEDVAKCKEAGFDEHLTKPINFQRLQLIMSKVQNTGQIEA